jgi:hypothetical protein
VRRRDRGRRSLGAGRGRGCWRAAGDDHLRLRVGRRCVAIYLSDSESYGTYLDLFFSTAQDVCGDAWAAHLEKDAKYFSVSLVWHTTPSTLPSPPIVPGTYVLDRSSGPPDDTFTGGSAQYAVVDDNCQPINGVTGWGISTGAFYQSGTHQGSVTITSVGARLTGTLDVDLGGHVHEEFDVPLCNLDSTEAAADPAFGPPVGPPYTCGP